MLTTFVAGTALAQTEARIPGYEPDQGGWVDTGSGYDIIAGLPSRRVIDFEVPGAVGEDPLRCERSLVVANTFGDFPPRSHWAFSHYYLAYAQNSNTIVHLPSGVQLTFRGSLPVRGHTIETPSGGLVLRLPDGGRVEFKRYSWLTGPPSNAQHRDWWAGTTITDSYGLETEVTPHNQFGPAYVEDASGRWIRYNWSGNDVEKAVSSAGQSVNYSVSNQQYWPERLITGVRYSDNTSARYDFSANTNLPTRLRDTRAASAVPDVEFEYQFDPYSFSYPVYLLKTERSHGVVLTKILHDEFSEYHRAEQRPNGAIRVFHYDRTRGELLDVRDVFNNIWTYTHNRDVGLLNSTDPCGAFTSFDREPERHKIVQVNYPEGHHSSVSYTDGPNPTPSSDPLYVYSVTDERGQTLTYHRDDNGRIERIEYPGEFVERWEDFDRYGQPRTHYLPDGSFEKFVYDDSGLLLRHSLARRSEEIEESIQYDYYPDGHVWEDRVKTVTDPRGYRTIYEYDVIDYPVDERFPSLGTHTVKISGRGLVTKITHPDGTEESFRYTNSGRRRLAVDENGNEWRWEYDDYNRLTLETNPLGETTTYRYLHYPAHGTYACTSDQPTSIIGPDGVRTEYRYDADLRLTHVIEAAGTADEAVSQIEYDLVGNISKEIDPMGRETTYEYDLRRRRTRRVAPGNRITLWDYDEVGNIVATLYPDGTVVTEVFDPMNRVKERHDELGRISKFTYDGLGRILNAKDSRGVTLVHSYNGAGNMTKRSRKSAGSDAIIGWKQYAYEAGSLVETRDERGEYTYYKYDSRSREYERGGSLSGVTTTEYDDAGNPRLQSSPVGVVEREFDALNRVTQETQSLTGHPARSVTYGYTPSGERDLLESSHRSPLYYEYTDRHQLRTIRRGSRGVLPEVRFSYHRDGQRHLQRIAYFESMEYEYDIAGRPIRVTPQGDPVGHLVDRSVGDSALSLEFVYDQRDRRVRLKVDDTLDFLYAYRADAQLDHARFSYLDHVESISYDYDESGNRTRFSRQTSDPYHPFNTEIHYTPDGLNQLTSECPGGAVYYDDAGNLVYQDGLRFDYDEYSRLTRVWTAEYPYAELLSLQYDAEGRLVVLSEGGETRYALYDGEHPIAWFDENGALLEEHTWIPGRDEIISTRSSANGATTYWQSDLQKNVIAAIGEHGLEEVYTYDPFGRMRAFAPGSFQSRAQPIFQPAHRFTGQRYFPSVGMYHYRARTYDPALGRFLQLDPIGYDAGDINAYRYVGNDPVNFTDPSGKVGSETIIIWGSADAATLDPSDLFYVKWALYAAALGGALVFEHLIFNEANAPKEGDAETLKKPKAGASGKEGAKDVPSWAKGERPKTSESGKDFAKRLLDGKYGPGNWKRGPGSEFNKIKKWGDRSFE
ncbi:MAG: RHS repeat-associated core domain-containing protein [Myxococcota bacterium]